MYLKGIQNRDKECANQITSATESGHPDTPEKFAVGAGAWSRVFLCVLTIALRKAAGTESAFTNYSPDLNATELNTGSPPGPLRRSQETYIALMDHASLDFSLGRR